MKNIRFALEKKGKWLDEISFVAEARNTVQLKDLFPTFIHEDEDVYMDCEYHKDTDTYHYILVFEDDAVDVTNLIDLNFMNHEMLKLSQMA